MQYLLPTAKSVSAGTGPWNVPMPAAYADLWIWFRETNSMLALAALWVAIGRLLLYKGQEGKHKL
jgi:hypothetical protein